MAIIIIVISNIWGRGMIRIIPILPGVVGSYLAAAIGGIVDFTPVADAPWIGLPVLGTTRCSRCSGLAFDAGPPLRLSSPSCPWLATIIEHIGDMSAISSTCKPQFHRRAGAAPHASRRRLATIMASLFGAPANTTYGENTGVLALTRVFDPRVVRIAAGFAILLSFCPKFAAVISCMPACVIGGVSLVFGMISAVGIRNLVENHVDFMASRNVLVTALILVLSPRHRLWCRRRHHLRSGRRDRGFVGLWPWARWWASC